MASLKDRMLGYENIPANRLIKKAPVIIRVDGRAFHTYTRGLDKPFDKTLIEAFKYTCEQLLNKIQGAKFIYSQSDEISILLTDWDSLETDAWFDYRIQKIVSISASECTLYFNKFIEDIISEGDLIERNYVYYKDEMTKEEYLDKYKEVLKDYNIWKQKRNKATFDSRAFNLPREEVCNYFIWRQKDGIRNSIQSLARSYYSHNDLNKKSIEDMVQMLEKDFNVKYDNLPLHMQRGFCITQEGLDLEIPLFTEDRNYIEKHLKEGEENEDR